MYYHVWFVTKYRKPTLEGETEWQLSGIFAECIERHGYNVLELGMNRDHLHLLLEAKDKKELSAIVRTLKAVSAKELLSDTPRFRVGNGSFGYYRRKPVEAKRRFWARRYGSREVDKNQIEDIGDYIRNQKGIQHD